MGGGEVPPLTYNSRKFYEAQNLINDIEGNYNLWNKITPNSTLQNNTSSVSLLLLNIYSDYVTPRGEQSLLIVGEGTTADVAKWSWVSKTSENISVACHSYKAINCFYYQNVLYRYYHAKRYDTSKILIYFLRLLWRNKHNFN